MNINLYKNKVYISTKQQKITTDKKIKTLDYTRVFT
jgi:hypothetical protein